MNHYTFEELKEGLTESFEVTVSAEMMEKFLAITGDTNPMHTDAAYARSHRGYNDRIVYGMLTASFLSTLGGVYLPGEHCLIHSVETTFPAPVFVGDTLTVSGTVKTVDERFHQAELAVRIVKSDGSKVLRGKMKVGVLGDGK
jgi:3-hydroxybutyryl-CoA dehydratase